MAKTIDIQCELSCDAEVVRTKGSYTRKQYSETMIGVIRYQSKLKTVFSTNYYGGKKDMKKRRVSIMDTTRKKRSIIMLGGVILSVMVSGLLVACNTMKEQEETPVQSETSTQKNETEASSSTPQVEEVLISADFAPDEITDEHDFFQDEYYLGSTHEPQKIMFSANVAVKDFKFIEIAWKAHVTLAPGSSWADANNMASNLYEMTVLHSLDELSPKKPFVATWLELGSMPHRGISFVDENNITRYFYISMNHANNGSEPLLLVEFLNYADHLIISLMDANTSEMYEKVIYGEERTPENIIKALIQENVLSSDTILNDFSVEEINGENVIRLDFNEAFTTNINQYGSSGAAHVQSSLCNTFLVNFYNADAVLVTVNGIPPASDHFDFSFPVYYYDAPRTEVGSGI